MFISHHKYMDSTRKLSYSPERVMRRFFKCLKLEASEMAKKSLLRLPSNAQLVSDV